MMRQPLDKNKPTMPTVLAREVHGTSHQLQCRVPEDLAFLDGHFERVAVVAGVVQVHWVGQWIAEILGAALDYQAMEAVKFHKLLFPGQTFEVVIDHDSSRGKWSFRITSDGHKIASGRFVERKE